MSRMDVPRPIIPVPATAVGSLRGRRLIIGSPGLGWRSDLRGDSAVVNATRTFVPVLAEQDWYRAESEEIEVFAPLVPIDRVWVAMVGGSDDVQPRPQGIFLDSPPSQAPVPAEE